MQASHGIAIYIPKTPGLSFRKLAEFWDLKRAEFPEIPNFGIPELQSLIPTMQYSSTENISQY